MNAAARIVLGAGALHRDVIVNHFSSATTLLLFKGTVLPPPLA